MRSDVIGPDDQLSGWMKLKFVKEAQFVMSLINGICLDGEVKKPMKLACRVIEGGEVFMSQF